MIEWVIRPYEGVGPINFGTTQAEVEAILGPLSDGYPAGLDIQVTFDDYGDGLCDCIGFYPDVDGPGSVGVVIGIRLIGVYSRLVKALLDRGYHVYEGEGLAPVPSLAVPKPTPTVLEPCWSGDTICEVLGISVRRETPEAATISYATAFRRGYIRISREEP